MGLNVAIIDGMTSCTAGDLTNLATSLLTDEGVVLTDNDDLLVEQSGTPGLSVLVSKGTCYVKNSNFTKHNGEIKYWHVTLDADGSVSIDANSSGSTRIDAICVKIDTGVSPDATASNVATLVAVKGTPGAGNPTIPDNHLLLAYVSVEDGETQILDADITDSRVYVGLSVAYGTVGFNLQDTEGTISARLYEDSDGKVILTGLKSGGGIRIDQVNNVVEKRGSVSDDWEEINQTQWSLTRQAIINGNSDVDQRVGPYTAGRNNDDVYTLDRWNLISDGNDVFDVSQEAITDLPGSNYAIKLDVETAKRGGIVQFLEAKDAQKFKGKTVSISFAVKSANISALRATVLSWAGTADSITSDVVGTWGATPTWAANWADNTTPADLIVTPSWTTVKVEGIVLDEATVNNLALVIWTPNEETIGDIVYITQIEMNEGIVSLPFMPKSYATELADCQRYYKRITSEDAAYTVFGIGQCFSTTAGAVRFLHNPTMRIKPTFGYSAAGDLVLTTSVDGVAAITSVSTNLDSKFSSSHNFNVASGLTAGNSTSLLSNNKTTAWIDFSAEL